MATSFIDNYFDGTQYMPTSLMTNIRANTDKNKIDVSLSCENGAGGDIETFYSTTLYAFNNVVELSDVGTLIEEYFRLRHKVADMITITFDDASIDAHFLYCEYAMPDAFDVSNTFFLASMVQRVHQDSMVTIAAYNHGIATDFIIKAVGRHSYDDNLGVVTRKVQRSLNNESSAYFSVAEIIKWALNQSDEEAGDELRDVKYFSIEYAGVQKMFFIVPAPAYLTFSFRNIFNVEEYIDVVGEITTKTEVSRDTAVCNGRSRQYDRNVSRSYEVQTEPLTSEEVSVFEQFLTSYEVLMYLEGNNWDVIITDHTCEPSSDDDKLTTVKFTWRFADKRPRLFDSAFDGIMPTRRRIFTEQFSPEYE